MAESAETSALLGGFDANQRRLLGSAWRGTLRLRAISIREQFSALSPSNFRALRADQFRPAAQQQELETREQVSAHSPVE